MAAPNMREHVRELVGQTVLTVARRRPNTIVRVTQDRAFVRTANGHENPASLRELQEIADRVWAGEEVEVDPHGRSAFHMAVMATLPDIAIALNPRRVWRLEEADLPDAEYNDLFPDEKSEGESEGRIQYREHRTRERSAALRRLKVDAALEEHGRLACEVCDLDFSERYGDLGAGFIECHHKEALGDGEERVTVLDDLALLCANCHRMVHRSRPMLSIEHLRERLRM